METRPPTITRILVAIGFALSCFALALFLWITFGGPLPLKPKGYRFTVPFDEATQLAVESDVRISGVSVGKVKSVELTTRARRRDDRARQPVRADPHQHAGDAAHEDPARRDLRRADPRRRAGPDPARRAAPCRRPRSPTRCSSTRSSAPSTPAPATPSRCGCRGRPRRCGPRPGLSAAIAELARLRGGDEPPASHPGQPGPRGAPAGPRRRRRLPGPLGAPGPAQRPDPELRGRVLDHGAAQPGPRRPVQDPADVPARVARHPGAAEQFAGTPTRSYSSCGPRRASSARP